MKAEAWIALASLGVLILNGLFVVIFIAGKNANQIRVLQEGAKKTDAAVDAMKGELADHKAQTTGLDATLGALKETVSEGFRRIEGAIADMGGRRPRARPAD